jgi:hypothetical protein
VNGQTEKDEEKKIKKNKKKNDIIEVREGRSDD